jgi:hypothetical protein
MQFFHVSLPVIMYAVEMIYYNEIILNSYLFRIFRVLGTADPVRLFISVMVQSLSGIEYQSHCREQFPEMKKFYSGQFKIYCPEKIRDYISRIANGMAAWKLFLFQAYIVRTQCPELIESGVLDIDVKTIRSASSLKEGAEIGFNKKAKGKPRFQMSASFIGRIFVDMKLFPGGMNPKNFFQKSVKRVKTLGMRFETVRADSAYLTAENLLFLTKLSLRYAIGAPAVFSAVKKGIEAFKKAARQKSPAVISAAKGVSIMDLGRVMIAPGVETRIIIVRRISRKKNRRTGQWKVRTYFYGIASNLKLTPAKLYAFYHKRQCIEAGFRELSGHYNLERLPFRGLKANEFWTVCKIIAMTVFKMFQKAFLPESLQHLLLKTFLRRILLNGLKPAGAGEVEILPKAKHTWLLRRILSKTGRMKTALNARVSTG